MADTHKRLIAPCSNFLFEQDDVNFDLLSFVQRMFLFDTFILYSTRLKEIPHMTKHFGVDGLIELLQSGALKIYCDVNQMAQTGQTAIFRRDRGVLPLSHYSFSRLRPSVRENYIHDCLQNAHRIDAPMRDIKKLKLALVRAIIAPPENAGQEMCDQLNHDLIYSPEVVKQAIVAHIQSKLGVLVQNAELSFAVHQVSEGDYYVESNVASILNVSTEDSHKLIEGGLLAIGTVNQRIEEMKSYEATSGFIDDENPLYHLKLDTLLGRCSSRQQERNIQRIPKMREIPSAGRFLGSVTVNAYELLRIRETPECLAFRNWVPSLHTVSDAEIADMLGSLRSRIADYLYTHEGQLVKMFIYSVVGELSGVTTGLALGALDIYLLEKIFPRPHLFSFVNRHYQSIFPDARPRIPITDFITD